MIKIPYSDKLDAQLQVDTEEWIAAYIKDHEEEDGFSEENLQQISQNILYIVLRNFRPDLLMES